MAPLGLCTKVFVNGSSIWACCAVREKRLGARSLPWALSFSEDMAPDSWRDPLAREPAQGSQRCPRGGDAESPQDQTPSIPGAGVHSVLLNPACVCRCLLNAVDEQDSAAVPGPPDGVGAGWHINSNYRTVGQSLWRVRVVQRGTLEEEA